MSLPCLTPLCQVLSIVIALWGLRLVTFLRVLMTLKVKSLYEMPLPSIWVDVVGPSAMLGTMLTQQIDREILGAL